MFKIKNIDLKSKTFATNTKLRRNLDFQNVLIFAMYEYFLGYTL